MFGPRSVKCNLCHARKDGDVTIGGGVVYAGAVCWWPVGDYAEIRGEDYPGQGRRILERAAANVDGVMLIFLGFGGRLPVRC